MKKIGGLWAAETLAELGELLGVHPDTAKRWRKQGLPGRSGNYPIRRAVEWLRTSGPWQPRGGDILLGNGEVSPQLERYRSARADLAELDVGERSSELVDRERMHAVLVIVANRYRSAADQLQRRFGPEAHAIVDKAVDDAQREVDHLFADLLGDETDARSTATK